MSQLILDSFCSVNLPEGPHTERPAGIVPLASHCSAPLSPFTEPRPILRKAPTTMHLLRSLGAEVTFHKNNQRFHLLGVA